MLNFISLGSGSSGNCYLLYTENDTLMIDAGVGIRLLKRHMKDYGIDIKNVGNIIVTHDHADHIKSVGAISTEYGIPVHATEKVHQGILRNYCVKKKVPQPMVRVIEKDKSFQLGDFNITPFDVPHDSMDNVGYRIEAQGITFCLMTDMGHITDDIRKNISLAQYLVIEANHDEQMLKCGPYPEYLKQRVAGDYGHMSNTTSARTVAECATQKLRHVWLCHLSQENNHPELARKTFETILAENGINVGEHLQLDVLKRKIPSGVFALTE